MAFFSYSWLGTNNNGKTNNVLVGLDVVILISVVIYIGLREPFAPEFGDSYSYSSSILHYWGTPFYWDWGEKSPISSNLIRYFGCNNYSPNDFYLLISAIYFGGIWYACRKLFPKDSLAAFLVYLAAFSTFSYSTNGIRAGVAASSFLVAITFNDYGRRNNLLLCFLFLLISIGFHHSMRLTVVAFVICMLIRKPQVYTAFWLVCLLIAALNITYFQELFVDLGEDMEDEKIIAYLTETSLTSKMGITGFRYDFVLYSAIPILIGWVMMYFKEVKSQSFVFLLNLYTLINAIWLLCIQAAFTNRIAYLSWSMYPIVLIYPFLNSSWGREHYNTFKVVAYGHLAFTLFMHIVYYG